MRPVDHVLVHGLYRHILARRIVYVEGIVNGAFLQPEIVKYRAIADFQNDKPRSLWVSPDNFLKHFERLDPAEICKCEGIIDERAIRWER